MLHEQRPDDVTVALAAAAKLNTPFAAKFVAKVATHVGIKVQGGNPGWGANHLAVALASAAW